MSRPSFPYLPNPDKWIDTASHPKKPTQRPLTALTNSFATPPSTLSRNAVAGPGPSTSAKRSNRKHDTPLEEWKQTTLSGFLTPPETTSEPRKRAGKVGRSRLREEKMSQRGSPMPRVSGKEVGRRQDEEDDYWRSDELAADEPQAKPTDKAVGPRMARSSSSDIIDLSVDHHALPPSSIPAIPSSGLPLALPPSSPSSKPPQHASELSERQLTPVPDDVREIHRRLCRQQPGRRRGRSPWRKPGDPEPEPPSAKKRKKLDATEQVTRRALEKAQVKGRKAGALVNLSDEETTPRKKAMPLSPIPPNILGAGQGSPRSRKVCKNPLLPLARLDKQTFTRSARESPFSPVRLEGGMAEGVKLAKANITPRPNRFADRFAGDDMIHVVPSAQHPPLRGPSPFALEPRPPTPSSPSSARSYSSSLPTSTPVKRTTPHHKITPPNFVTPIKSSHWQEHMETLFSFPPPPQPYFVRDEAEAGSRKAFVPTEMQSETLMTWSLGPADPGTRAPQRAFLSRDRDRIKGDQADHETLPPARPSIHPVSKRKRPQSPKPSLSPSKDGDTQSIAPSVASQSFPRLLPSSPPQRAPASSTSMPRVLAVQDDITNPLTPNPGMLEAITAPTRRRTEADILSAPPPPAPPSSQNTSAKRMRASTSSRRSEGEGQTKLAAFGFFGETKRPKEADFGKDWEEDEDLEFEPDDPLGTEELPRQSAAVVEKAGLGSSPNAPYHPSLRPAGIREMQRREREAAPTAGLIVDAEERKDSPPFPVPRRSSTDESSSLSTDAEGIGGPMGDMTESVREWWDTIGQRRSSEFQGGSSKS